MQYNYCKPRLKLDLPYYRKVLYHKQVKKRKSAEAESNGIITNGHLLDPPQWRLLHTSTRVIKYKLSTITKTVHNNPGAAQQILRYVHAQSGS
jgi:hypothetical protein